MSSIVKDEQGVYRWVYEYNLLTNPTILLTIGKIFAGIIVGFCLFMLVLLVPDLVRGSADASNVAFTFQLTGIMFAIFAVLLVIGYGIFAAMQGGKPSQVGLGMATAARESMTSAFANVRSVIGSRALQVIKVNEPLAKNQVYVEPEDYDFVFGYIAQRCTNAKTVRGS